MIRPLLVLPRLSHVCVTTAHKIHAYSRFGLRCLNFTFLSTKTTQKAILNHSVRHHRVMCALDRVLEVSNLRFELIHLFPFGVDALSFPCLQDVARQVFLLI